MTLQDYLLYALTILGAISATAHALEPLVKLTKTEKDDIFLSKVNLVLSKLLSFLSAVASPKKS